jgi:hypothetical protein
MLLKKTSLLPLLNMAQLKEFNSQQTARQDVSGVSRSVEMSSDAEEKNAIEELDGAEWMGRILKVNKAKPREDNRGSGNSFGGGRQRY